MIAFVATCTVLFFVRGGIKLSKDDVRGAFSEASWGAWGVWVLVEHFS